MLSPWRAGLPDKAVLAARCPSLTVALVGEPGLLVAFVNVGEPGHGFDEVFGGFNFSYLMT